MSLRTCAHVDGRVAQSFFGPKAGMVVVEVCFIAFQARAQAHRFFRGYEDRKFASLLMHTYIYIYIHAHTRKYANAVLTNMHMRVLAQQPLHECRETEKERKVKRSCLDLKSRHRSDCDRCAFK